MCTECKYCIFFFLIWASENFKLTLKSSKFQHTYTSDTSLGTMVTQEVQSSCEVGGEGKDQGVKCKMYSLNLIKIHFTYLTLLYFN